MIDLTTFLRKPALPIRPGIALQIVPGDTAYLVEVQRAPDSGGSPGTWVSILNNLQITSRSGEIFYDFLPVTGATWWYRARHVRLGATDGNWTASIAGVARDLGTGVPALVTIYPLKRNEPLTDGDYALAAQDSGGVTTPGTIYVPDTDTIGVGTQAVPSSLSKVFVVTSAGFIPEHSGTLYVRDGVGSYVTANAVSSQQNFLAPLILPPGVTITKIELRGFKTAAGDTLAAYLNKEDGSGTPTNLATADQGSTTGYATTAATLSETVNGTYQYSLRAEISNLSAVGDARLLWVKVYYDMPSYDRGL